MSNAATLIVNGAENDGFYIETDVFKTSAPVYYRIPNALTTNSGCVFLFCNDRHGGVQDNNEIQWIVFSKAEDGVNFSEPQYLLKQDGWQYVIGAAVYDAVNDNIMLFYKASIRSSEAQNQYDLLPVNEREPIGNCILESNDNGQTWKKRQISIPRISRYPYGIPHTHGASAGIQLKNGEHAGRLCVAAYTAVADSLDVSVMAKSCWSCILYSDDFGNTWKVSNTMPAGTGESTLCEMSDGSLYLNCRTHYGDNSRYIGISYDGGTTISESYQDETLVQPGEGGVKGSVIHFENPEKNGEYITLFSCLNISTGMRRNLCIWMSYDNGKTWKDSVVIDGGYAAYSDMTYNPVTKYVTVLYERGNKGPNSDGIRAVTFDVTWLMKNKKPVVPLRVNTVSDSVYAEIVLDSQVAHFDAGSLVDYSNGDTLSVWKDSSGCDNHAGKPLVGKQPIVKTNAIEGYPVAYFGSEGLSLETNEITDLDGDCSYFIVFKSNGTLSGKNPILLTNSHSYGLTTFLRTTTGCFSTKINTKYNVTVDSNTFLDTKYHILAVSWSGQKGDDSLLTQYLDGSKKDVKFATGEYVKVDRASSGVVTIGRDFYGEIAEIILYKKALNDDEVAKTGLALAQKYGLTWDGVSATNPKSNSPENNVEITENNVEITGIGGNSSDTDKNESRLPKFLLPIAKIVLPCIAALCGIFAVISIVKKKK